MSQIQKPERKDLRIYRGLSLSGEPPSILEQIEHRKRIPPPPPWRTFGLTGEAWTEKAAELETELTKNAGKTPNQLDVRAKGFVAREKAIELVNAALCLRRPLLIEGNPGAGKTSLAYAVSSRT
jgi:DNA polymerase III delta prime subunit